jgi:hypothetical protein
MGIACCSRFLRPLFVLRTCTYSIVACDCQTRQRAAAMQIKVSFPQECARVLRPFWNKQYRLVQIKARSALPVHDSSSATAVPGPCHCVYSVSHEQAAGLPYLCWFDSITAKIPRSLGTKKKPGNHGTEQTVNGEFTERVKGAQNYVECDPGKRPPARSVVSSEHKCSTDNR